MSRIDQKAPSLEEAIKPVKKKPSPGTRAWHDEQTRKAVQEADAGDFASAEELRATIRKFVPNG